MQVNTPPDQQFDTLCENFLNTTKDFIAPIDPVLNAIRGMKMNQDNLESLSSFILEESANLKEFLCNLCKENEKSPCEELKDKISASAAQATAIHTKLKNLSEDGILKTDGIPNDELKHFRIFVQLVSKRFDHSLCELSIVTVKTAAEQKALDNEIEKLFRDLRMKEKTWSCACAHNYLMYIDHLKRTYQPEEIATSLTEIFPDSGFLYFLYRKITGTYKSPLATLAQEVNKLLSNKFLKEVENVHSLAPSNASMAKHQCFQLFQLFDLKSEISILTYSHLLYRYNIFADDIIMKEMENRGNYNNDYALINEFISFGTAFAKTLCRKISLDKPFFDSPEIDVVFGSLLLANYYEDLFILLQGHHEDIPMYLTSAIRRYSVKTHGTQVLFSILCAIKRWEHLLKHDNYRSYLTKVYLQMAYVNDNIRIHTVYETVRKTFNIPSDRELVNLYHMPRDENMTEHNLDVHNWFQTPHTNHEMRRNYQPAQPVQLCQRGQPVQNDQNGHPVQHAQYAYPVQHFLPVQNVLHSQHHQPVQNVQYVQNTQQGHPVQHAQYTYPVQHFLPVQNVLHSQHHQPVQNVHHVQNTQHGHPVQHAQYAYSVQNVQHSQHHQPVQNVQHVQNTQHSHPVQHAQYAYPVQHFLPVQNVQHS